MIRRSLVPMSPTAAGVLGLAAAGIGAHQPVSHVSLAPEKYKDIQGRKPSA